MPSLKLLRLQFDTPIKPYELPEFRDVITDFLGFTGMYIVDANWSTAGELIDLEKDIEPPVELTYPLLQWRLHKRGNGFSPGLICLSDWLEKVEESLLKNSGSNVIVNGRPYEIWCPTPVYETVDISTANRLYSYEVHQYLPVEGRNLAAFNRVQDWNEKRQIVDLMLLNHLFLFAQAVSADLTHSLRVDNLIIYRDKEVVIADQAYPAFRLKFQSNLSIPDQVGIGCKAGLGYGVLHSKL